MLSHQDLAFLYAQKMSIGTRLRQLRKSKSWTQERIGEICGVTKGMVSQWELDESFPPTDRLLKLQREIPFSFDWLFNGDAAYSTSDPKIIAVAKAMEPTTEEVKNIVVKAVLPICELNRARAAGGGTNS